MIQFASPTRTSLTLSAAAPSIQSTCNVVTVIKVNSKRKEQLQRDGTGGGGAATAGKDEVGSVRQKKRRELLLTVNKLAECPPLSLSLSLFSVSKSNLVTALALDWPREGGVAERQLTNDRPPLPAAVRPSRAFFSRSFLPGANS